jgi:hypothetical protein
LDSRPRISRTSRDLPIPGSPASSHLALAVARLPPAAQQQRDLLLPADERREPLAVQRLEPAFGRTLAFDSPGGKRLGEAFETKRTEIGQLEQAADEPARRLTDDHAAWRCERLQPRREVRHVADHGRFAGGAFADQVAHHRRAGSNAYAGL